METWTSDKRIVAVLGLAVGAGIALTFTYYWGGDKKRRMPRPAKTSCPISRSAVQTRAAGFVSPSAAEAPPEPQPSTHPAPAVVSVTHELRTHRMRAGVLDALIVFFACCVFIAISQASGVSAPSDRFSAVVLMCSAGLIGVFYTFLFRTCGCETPGQIWQKRGFELAWLKPVLVAARALPILVCTGRWLM